MAIHEFGPFTLWTNESDFSRSKVLKEIEEGFKILKKETEGERINETRYVFCTEDEELAFIRGFKDGSRFHINRIENTIGDKNGGKYLSALFSITEDDLRKEGIEKITTNALVRLAPILIKRYGFEQRNDMTDEEIEDKADLEKKFVAIPLVKFL